MINFLTLIFLPFPSITQLSRDKDYWFRNIKYCILPSKMTILVCNGHFRFAEGVDCMNVEPHYYVILTS